MMTRISKTIGIVKGNIMLVAIVSLAGIWIRTDSSLLNTISFFSFLLFAVVLPILYGRCSESLRNKQRKTVADLLGNHLLNFWMVSIVMLIPGIITRTLLDVTACQIDKKIIGLAVGTAVNVLAIYILPAVFLDRINFRAVPMGIKYLLTNIRKSLLLILLTIIVFTIKIAAYLAVRHLHVLKENIWIVFSIGYISNILSLCIALAVFIIASLNILDDTASESINEVSP